VKDDDIIGRLQYIADQEKLSIERETLRIIAHHANGSFRDGISLLDQLQSLEKITIADVEERIGVSVHIVAEEMMSALEEMNAQHIHQLIEKSENSGFAPDLFLSTIIERLREQLHAHIERKEKIDILLSSIDQLMQGLKNVRSSPLPYLTLEATLLSIGAQEKRSDSPSQKPKEILQEEKKEEKAPIKIEQVIQEEQKPTLTQAEEFSKEMIQKHWREIIESVPIPSAKMSMKTASIRGVEGKILHLAFPSNFNKEKVEEPKARHAIEEILRQLFKQPIELRCQMETEVTPNLSMEKANLADAALEVFGSF
jgi:DNA polymerase-3 subunit gamma/tau